MSNLIIIIKYFWICADVYIIWTQFKGKGMRSPKKNIEGKFGQQNKMKWAGQQKLYISVNKCNSIVFEERNVKFVRW